MSRVEELENEIKGLENRRLELLKQLELEKLGYPFEEEEKYWSLSDLGTILSHSWDNHQFEIDRYSQGHLFKTEQEAKRERDRRALLTRFRQFRDKCNGYWKTESDDIKYYIVLKRHNLELSIYSNTAWNAFNIFGYFKNKKDAERAIELFGDEIVRLWVEE